MHDSERWTIEGRIMEDSEPGDFELLWVVTSGPKPPHDGYEVNVVRQPQAGVWECPEHGDTLLAQRAIKPWCDKCHGYVDPVAHS